MKKLVTLFLVICLALSLVGFAMADASAKEDIVIVMQDDMDTFQPMVSESLINQNVCMCVYDSLFELNSDLEGVPYLVKEWKWVDDLTAEFTIYDNITFHDGNIMDTEDIKFCMDYARSIGWLSYLAEDIEIVDATTFRMNCSVHYPAIATDMTGPQCWILEKEYYEEALKTGDFSNPMTSGRYTVANRIPGESVTVTRFDNYWNQNDPALNSSITFKAIPESANRTIMLETGEADLNANFSTADYNRIKENPDLQLVDHYSSTLFYLGFDCQEPSVFANEKVRLAIAYAIDRNGIIAAGMDGLGTPQYSTVPPNSLAYIENPGNWTYDVEKAKALLEESGVELPINSTIYCDNDSFERIGTVVASYLSKIGINLTVERCQGLTTLANANKLPMYVYSWGCYADPDLHLMYLYGKEFIGSYNYCRYTSDWFEALRQKGRTVDEAARIEAYTEIQNKFAEIAPTVPMFTNYQFVSARAGLQGIQLDTESPFHYHTLHY